MNGLLAPANSGVTMHLASAGWSSLFVECINRQEAFIMTLASDTKLDRAELNFIGGLGWLAATAVFLAAFVPSILNY
jgi:hypothetical protein